MDRITLRLLTLGLLLVSKVRLFAQLDKRGMLRPSRRGNGNDIDEMSGMYDGMDAHSFDFGFTEVLMVLLLIAACYVFGKIWKGCTYLLLMAAGLYIFLMYY